jgi:hypothetical protein
MRYAYQFALGQIDNDEPEVLICVHAGNVFGAWTNLADYMESHDLAYYDRACIIECRPINE